MKKLLLVAALAASIPSAALAADLGSNSDNTGLLPIPRGSVTWSSIYFGGQIGYGNANHDFGVGYDDGEGTGSAYLDGINSHGFLGGLTVGADLQRGPVVFGVFGQYDFSAIDTKAGFTINGDNVGVASIEEGDSWLVGGRLGYVFNGRTLLYGLAGYGQTDVKYSVTGLGSDTRTINGWTIGGGAEYALTKNVALYTEYQHKFLDTETLYSDNVVSLTDDIDTDTVMVGLKAKLNADVFGK